MTLLESISTGFSSILKSITDGFADLKSSLAAKPAADATELTELKATIQRQEQEIAGLKAVQKENADLQKTNGEQATALAAKDAEIAKLKAEALTGDEAAAKKAQAMVAGQGVPASKIVNLNQGANGGSRDELLAKFNSFTDPKERAKFYNENRKALLGQ